MEDKKKRLRIAMAGGGTGGHVFPIRSLLEFLYKNKEYGDRVEKIYRFGAKKSLEQQVCSDIQEDNAAHKLVFVPIYSGKYRRESYRRSKLKNISDFFLFIIGCFQSIFHLLYHRINIVFCKGGYVALPVVIAATLLRKKIVVHESDTRPGLVNKIASRFAKKVFTGFEGTLLGSQTVGQILSDDIVIDAHPEFTTKTQVLIVGGSQGSKRLYQNILHILEFIPDLSSGYDFFIVLGLLSDEMSTHFDKFPHVHTYGFVSQKKMGELYNACDITITRGGTTSLAEQKLYDMKQIIIPIPRTHDQYENAKWYVRCHNDVMINQRDHDFEAQLGNAIKHFKGFKKNRIQKDKRSIISHAKKIIRDSLLSA
ncbi:MAG: glycosyltransferase [candidate division SR1 bacterium]|nr:glycosyltransferase [candidate division SR1 bacterium]